MSFSIVTRYNVRSSFAREDVNDPGWLSVRRDLFERYCAPFVLAQSDQDFNWFVFVDNDMPQDEADWLTKMGRCQIVRCGSQTEGINKIREEITSGFDLVLTTRLDSDDSLAPNFVEEMRRAAHLNADDTLEREDGFVVCFPNGVEHDTPSEEWFGREYPGNPFIGFLEPATEDAKMIFHKAHYEMPKSYPTANVETVDPMWCIRVHGGNVANVIKGTPLGAAPVPFIDDQNLAEV